MSVVPAVAQYCWDSTTGTYGETTAVRLNGNAVRLNAHTEMIGNYSNWWYPALSTNWYFNSTFQTASGWRQSGTLGAAYDYPYDPTLQTYGPGRYTQNTSHDAYTPYCGLWMSEVCYYYGCVYPPPWGSSDYIDIQRPARPDYAPGSPRALWYLGLGIAYDGNYPAETYFTPGNANGAPESPVYVISYGTPRISLNCTNCTTPLASAIGASDDCQYYDVQINTSYNGFLSDPFFLFINRPWSVVSANDPIGGTWNWTRASGNGWASNINYTTLDLCTAAMAGYHINEGFGSWTSDYLNTTWNPPSPAPGYVPGTQWADFMSFECPAGNCAPMPQNPPPGCWPACGTTKVQHSLQTFSVGSSSLGAGLPVLRNQHQRWRDHGSHEDIVTPVP